jgi:hypothetical protein
MHLPIGAYPPEQPGSRSDARGFREPRDWKASECCLR